MKVCDSHIHVGQFFGSYTSPQMLINLTDSLGIEKYAVSSTTICEENYSKVLRELEYLSIYDSERAFPVLWITPRLLSNQNALNDFFNSGLQWRCIKIHPDLHPNFWTKDNGYFEVVIDLAKENNLPLLIHTGGNDYSQAGIWEKKIASNISQIFILAHSRPFNQTIELMQRYENVWADLAFVDENEMKLLIESKVSKRLLWGSDVPITRHYLHHSMKSYYRDRLCFLMDISPREIFESIVKDNFKKLFEGCL